MGYSGALQGFQDVWLSRDGGARRESRGTGWVGYTVGVPRGYYTGCLGLQSELQGVP
jgi:hypothetical protein